MEIFPGKTLLLLLLLLSLFSTLGSSQYISDVSENWNHLAIYELCFSIWKLYFENSFLMRKVVGRVFWKIMGYGLTDVVEKYTESSRDNKEKTNVKKCFIRQ